MSSSALSARARHGFFVPAFFMLIFHCLLVPASAAFTTFLSGSVTSNGKPAPGVKITVSGNNTVVRTTTNAQGRFSFSTLSVGTYDIDARSDAGQAHAHLDISGNSATVSLSLAAQEIGNVSVTRSSEVLQGSGTDLTLNAVQLQRMPGEANLPQQLIQLPGAARGANGVVHINGDHGDINYIVDGVPVPQALNRAIGTELDSADIGYMEALEGAYPAQYGGRFASVLNINTKNDTGPAGFKGEINAGSYASLDTILGYHTAVGKGSLVLDVRNQRSNRAEDPPNFTSPHDQGSDSEQFLRYTLPQGNDYLNVTLNHAYHTYQIPNDVQRGQPATSDDNELQDDTFLAMQYHHAINEMSSISFGPGFKRSQVRDLGDPANDFAYGEALNLAGGGDSTDCANAVSSGAFSPTTCGYSLNGDKTSYDYLFNGDYVLHAGAHEVRAGTLYDVTNVNKHYAVTLQPGNFLAPIFTPNTPDAPYTVMDNAPNTAATESIYLQDAWMLGQNYRLDYGVRDDAFQEASNGAFRVGYSQLSPRVKFTRNFGSRANVYLFYGRFFTPFSSENVAPAAAQTLNLPLQRSVASFDLKPQRDSDYEIGGHLPIGSGDLGLRVMQKNATDLIDDTQVGVTNLHQDINYQLGRIAVQTLYYQLPLARQGRVYVSANHTYSKNKGCETQLLAPCFGTSTDWTPADHEQPWGATAGILVNDKHGGWFSADGEYGNGLSSAVCPPDTPGFCHETPHIVLDVEKGFSIGHGTAAMLRIHNLLNDRYFVTILNAQGTHFAAPRTFEVGVRFGG